MESPDFEGGRKRPSEAVTFIGMSASRVRSKAYAEDRNSEIAGSCEAVEMEIMPWALEVGNNRREYAKVTGGSGIMSVFDFDDSFTICENARSRAGDSADWTTKVLLSSEYVAFSLANRARSKEVVAWITRSKFFLSPCAQERYTRESTDLKGKAW